MCLRSGAKGSRFRSSRYPGGGRGFIERKEVPTRNFSLLKDTINVDNKLLNPPPEDFVNMDILSASPGLQSVDELNILAYSFFSSSEEPEAPAVEDFIPKTFEDLTNLSLIHI